MKLIHVANKYCRESDWKVLLLLKICLLSAGMIAGMLIPKEKRKAAFGFGIAAFIISYLPLMNRLCRTWRQDTLEQPHEL